MIKSKTNKLGIKMVAIVLSFIMIVTVIPGTSAFAKGKNVSSDKGAIGTTDITEKNPEFVAELNEKRTLNEKHFLMDDGSITVAQYNQPVHFVDADGAMKDIDNSLVEITDTANDKKLYRNKSNSFSVSFSAESGDGDLASMEKEENKISWSLEQNNTASAKSSKAKNSTDKKADELENITSYVEYDNIFDSTDVTYVTNASGVKENIVLKDEYAPKQFSFNYNTYGLKYRVTDEGNIELYNERDPETVVFYIEKPYMFDAQKYRSDDVKMEISETENGFEATIIPDEEWVNSPERVFPIVIDPTVLSSQIRNQIWDIDMMQGQTQDFSCNAEDLMVGVDSQGRIFRSVVKFLSLPQLNDCDTIVSAAINITAYQGPTRSGSPAVFTRPSGNPKVYINRVTQDWPQTTNWNTTANAYDSTITDYFVYNTTDVSFQADITKIVKGWYDGTYPNYGIMLRSADESTTHKAMQFTSSDWGSNNAAEMSYRPVVLVNYRDNKGIENYWTYTTMPAGRDGTAAVNNFNGNLIVEQNITGISGNRMPVGISLFYDSGNRTYNNHYVGKGWRTSYNVLLSQVNLPNHTYCLLDSDGTKHYFSGVLTDSQFEDEDGLGLTLTRNPGTSSAYYVITDKEKNKTYFDTGGRLTSISDAVNNSITVNYGNQNKISSLIDGAGRTYTFSYNGAGNLTGITNPAGKVVSFSYDTNYNLTAITYPGNITTSFEYGISGLNKVISPDSTYTKFVYAYNSTTAHLSTISLEYYGSDNTLNSDYDFVYNSKSTDITSNCDNTVNCTYQFDSFGRTSAVINNCTGTAEYYKYGAPGGNSTGTENKLLSVGSVPQPTTTFYTDNGTYGNSTKWYLSSDSTDTILTVDATRGNNSAPSLELTQDNNSGGCSKAVFDAGILPGGHTYDFSVRINTGGMALDTDGLSVNAYYYDGSDFIYSNTADNSVIGYTSVGDWITLSAKLTLTNSEHCYAVIGGNINSPGSFWLDDLLICVDSGSEHYNYVGDGAFLNGQTTWTYKVNNNVSTNGVGYYADSKCRIDGSITDKRSVSQTISCTGHAGDPLAFGAWGKADSVYTGIEREGYSAKSTFRVRLEISGQGGAATFSDNSNILDFNYASDVWQFVSGVVIAPIDFTEITLYFDYDHNANSAYFRSPYVYKENHSQSYAYDEKGNVISAVDLSQAQAKFAYQSNNLSQMINPTGSRFSYSYDENTNLMTYANSSNGQFSAFEYDQYGNPTSATTTAAYFGFVKTPDINGDGNVNNKDLTRLNQYISGANVTINEAVSDVNRDGTIDSEDVSALFEYLSDWAEYPIYTNCYIRNLFTGNAMKKSEANLVNGTYASQNDSIKWKLISANETDTYYIQSVEDTSKYLTVENGSSANNTKIVLAAMTNGDSQKFKIVPNDDYSYFICTKVSNYTAAIDGRDFTDGESTELEKNMVQHTLDSSSGHQKWRFDECGQDVSGEKRILSTAAYTADGNYISSVTDSYGSTASYTYNTDGTVSTATNAAGVSTSYSYNGNTGELQSVTSGGSTNTYTYQNDRIKTITTSNGTVYTFNYDNFGRKQSVDINKVNSGYTARRLADYQYNSDVNVPTNGGKNNLRSMLYGNGNSYSVSYNSAGQIASKGNATYRYNQDNLLYQMYTGSPDLGAANYFRDLSGRIIQKNIAVNDYNSINNTAALFTLNYSYLSKKNLLDKLSLAFCGSNYLTTFVYGDQNKGEDPGVVYGLNFNNNLQLRYQYDKFARQTLRTLKINGNSILKRYGYKTNTQNNATGYLIDTVTENGYTYNYSYDSLGNITGYSKKYAGNVENYLYEYDNKGQLTFAGTSANDGITYTYDSNGNILTKHNSSDNTTITYGYTDPTWADLLTSYNGNTITYDTIGNPLTYNNGTAMTFTWGNGRNLQTVSKGGSSIGYSYDSDSYRTSKTVDGAYTQYIVLDGVLYGERRYNNTGYDLIIYLYDENGNKYGFTYNGTGYYYQTNLQGDVVGIYDSTGQLVVQYTYDTWGKLLSVTGTLASTIGQINPIRYRGYYYDNETGFYYLQSRYYDPETGRFLNADGFVSTGQEILGHNMFAYCGNNPVNRFDPNGIFFKEIKEIINRIIKTFVGFKTKVGECFSKSTLTSAQKEIQLIVAQTIYGEEHGRTVYDDWKQGQQAVASVILNRSIAQISYLGKDLETICKKDGQFDGFYKGKRAYESGEYDAIAWDSAMELAADVVLGDLSLLDGITVNHLYFNKTDTYKNNIAKNGGKFSFGSGTMPVIPKGVISYGGNTFFYY